MFHSIRDWVTSVPLIAGFGSALVGYDLAGRVARVFGIRPFETVMAALQRTLVVIFRATGTRVIVERDPAIRPRTGYALISNHQSLFDIALIGGYLFSNFPKYVAKRELGRWIPSISLNLRHGGNALIDRKNRRQAITAIQAMAAEAQRRNVSVVIFPEGSRSRDGSLQEFRRAGSAAMLASAPDLPVIPVAIDGSWRLLTHNLFPVPFRTTVRIRFGAPIGRAAGDATQLLAEARSRIDATLRGWRAVPAT